jgi:hypothetical protein
MGNLCAWLARGGTSAGFSCRWAAAANCWRTFFIIQIPLSLLKWSHVPATVVFCAAAALFTPKEWTARKKDESIFYICLVRFELALFGFDDAAERNADQGIG